MSLVEVATQFITRKYEGKYRPGSNIPNLDHAFGVALILENAGYRNEVVIAGLLHGSLEDEMVTTEEIQRQFGQDILQFVKGAAAFEQNTSWHERNSFVIQQIPYKTDEQLAITLAGKINKINAITEEVLRVGEKIWDRFKAPKEKQEGYYRRIIEEVTLHHPNARLLEQLKDAVNKLFVRVEL